MEIISFRSDTETLPTPTMLDAMRSAPLGDDVYGEDPTVNKLESLAAQKLGKQAAMLVISGTMGNLISIMAHANPGDEVILDPESHIFYYEVGGMARVAGLMPMPVTSKQGLLDPDDVAAAIRKRNIHYPVPRLLCLENTHNRSGGRVIPLELHQRLCRVAHEKGLIVHLDGARIFNAAVATGIPVSDFARDADSVMFCLSKGLSCPLGSVIAGTKEFIEKARRCRKCLGGGMRQAGIIAAAGIVALDQMIDRLAEDHAYARLLAQGINQVPGLHVDLNTVETNMVNVDVTHSGLDIDEVLNRLKHVGILAGGRPPGCIRLVTNRHHTRNTIEEAVLRIRKTLEKGR